MKNADKLVSLKGKMKSDYEQLVSELPTRSEIFLPTDKYTVEEKIEGVKKVKSLYSPKKLELYRGKLEKLKKKYEGKDRCFIIGNGPSLNATDLERLNDEVTFAVNGFFLQDDKLSWKPDFYVVEDHLVAEDRKEWIDKYKGVYKLFPIYLGYCFDENEDTLFFKHLPRKSYPHGFDFSTDATNCTYAGCTVTYTCMQLAYYLGFKEIYLIGVDASYSIPADAKSDPDYGVSVLDMKSDDPNHFDPSYFGKGFRWHDPQVDKMVEAYREAKKVTESNGVQIINATIGGKLEVFERASFSGLFPKANSPAYQKYLKTKDEVIDKLAVKGRKAPEQNDLKLMIFDITKIGDGTATGEIKSNILSYIKPENISQVYSVGKGKISHSTGGNVSKIKCTPEDVKRYLNEFSPDVILYRPVPDNDVLHDVAMSALRQSGIPFMVWVMDDWLARMEMASDPRHQKYEADLNWLIENAASRLSICDAMSDSLAIQYKRPFVAIANGIDPAEWERSGRRVDKYFRVRYAGALAENMSLQSVLRIAQAVERLSKNIPIQFEIRTKPIWEKLAREKFKGLKATRFLTDGLSSDAYKSWLQGADCLVVAYNFDPESVRYTKMSFSNKMPECLASGAVTLAHGPSSVATINYLLEEEGAALALVDSVDCVEAVIEEIVKDEKYMQHLTSSGRNLASNNHHIFDKQKLFEDQLQLAKGSRNVQGFSRSDKAHFDETFLLSKLMEGVDRGFMIDVGAHHGTALAPFRAMGWNVYAFEPDSDNRKVLKSRFGEDAEVKIDPRAVGEKEELSKPFFRSDQSTGISGLLAFTDGHQVSQSVEVTTLAEVIEAEGIKQVDFLKVDVEGYDWSVLKSFPWGSFEPQVIECEYEDAKTSLLGHSWTDVAAYLESKGYSVYISEWFPIERYGIRHSWRYLHKFPCKLKDKDSWGNILAFKNDPGRNHILKVLSTIIDRPPELSAGQLNTYLGLDAVEGEPVMETVNEQKVAAKTDALITSRKPFYFGFGEYLKLNTPSLFRFGQLINSVLKGIGKQPLIAGLMFASIFALLLINSSLISWSGDITLIANASLLLASGFSFVLLCVAAISDRLISVLHDVEDKALQRTKSYRRRVQDIQARLTNLEDRVQSDRQLSAERQREVEAEVSCKLNSLEQTVKTRVLDITNELRAFERKVAAEAVEAQGHFEALTVELNHLDERAQVFGSDLEDHLKRLAIEVGNLNERFQTFDLNVENLIAKQQFDEGLLSTLQVDITSIRNDLGESFSKANEKVDCLHNALDEKSTLVDGAVDRLEERVNSVTQRVDQGISELAGKLKNHEAVSEVMIGSNASGYQRFSRKLSDEKVDIFLKKWNRSLGTRYSRSAIYYLADRISKMESTAKGRLATSIENMLLRIIVASSVRGDSLRCLEIGSLFGIGLFSIFDTLSDRFKDIQLSCIDPLDGYYGSNVEDVLTGQVVSQKVFWSNADRLAIPRDKVTLIPMLSTDVEAIEQANSGKIDLLIIDGDHSYAGVKADFVNYVSAVNLGGYIIFDDYESKDWPDVSRFVDEYVEKQDYLAKVGSSWNTAVYKVVKDKT